jgi:hypothetical protein
MRSFGSPPHCAPNFIFHYRKFMEVVLYQHKWNNNLTQPNLIYAIRRDAGNRTPTQDSDQAKTSLGTAYDTTLACRRRASQTQDSWIKRRLATGHYATRLWRLPSRRRLKILNQGKRAPGRGTTLCWNTDNRCRDDRRRENETLEAIRQRWLLNVEHRDAYRRGTDSRFIVRRRRASERRKAPGRGTTHHWNDDERPDQRRREDELRD